MDKLDRAQELEEAERKSAVEKRRAASRKQALFPSLHECESCLEDIPEERQKAIPGVSLCVHCKSAVEQRL